MLAFAIYGNQIVVFSFYFAVVLSHCIPILYANLGKTDLISLWHGKGNARFYFFVEKASARFS